MSSYNVVQPTSVAKSNYNVVPPTTTPTAKPSATPFDNTPLGIIKNTITGIPAAAAGLVSGAAKNIMSPILAQQKKVNTPPMTFPVGQGLTPAQTTTANKIVKAPQVLPTEPLTFGESQSVFNQKIASDYAAKNGKPFAPNQIPDENLVRQAVTKGFLNPVIGASAPLADVSEAEFAAMTKESYPNVIANMLTKYPIPPEDVGPLSQKLAQANTVNGVKNVLSDYTPSTTPKLPAPPETGMTTSSVPNDATTPAQPAIPNSPTIAQIEKDPSSALNPDPNAPPQPQPPSTTTPGQPQPPSTTTPGQPRLFNGTPPNTGGNLPITGANLPTSGENIPPVNGSSPSTGTASGNPIKPVNFKITGNTEAQKLDSAITNSERAKNELSIRGKDAYATGNGSGLFNSGLSPHDIKLAEGYQTGTTIPELAKQADNPTKFTDFMNKTVDYYNFRHAADIGAGGQTPYVKNYLPQYWDLSKPTDLANYNKLAVQKGLQPYNGFNAQPRVFGSYGEGEKAGFTRANPNILEDLKTDYQKASSGISKQVLKKGLAEAAPDKVSFHGLGRTANGTPFLNSNIPGLQGISYAPEISDALKGFESLTNKDFIRMAQQDAAQAGTKVTLKGLANSGKEAGLGNVLGTLYDHANSAIKHTILNLSGFHSINITGSFAGSSLFHPISGTAGVTMSIPSFFSEKVTQGVIDAFKNKMIPGTNMSVFDAGLRSGVNMDRALPGKGLQNPMKSLSSAIFDRELYTLKLNLVDQVFGDGKVDPESVKGRAIAKEINLVMGEMNGKLQNINPNTQKWFSRVLLAPGFTESKYTVLGHAGTKFGKETAGNFARTSVLGKSLVIGAMAILGNVLATGKFPSLHQALLDFTTSPSSKTNIVNSKGQHKDISFPKTFVDEPLSMLQDPGSYVRSRFAPALTDIYESLPPSVIGTGKNYYGAPTVNPSSKVSPVVQTIKNVGISNLPIGLQSLINFETRDKAGKREQGPLETALQIGGLSTHIRPKTKVISTQNNY